MAIDTSGINFQNTLTDLEAANPNPTWEATAATTRQKAATGAQNLGSGLQDPTTAKAAGNILVNRFTPEGKALREQRRKNIALASGKEKTVTAATQEQAKGRISRGVDRATTGARTMLQRQQAAAGPGRSGAMTEQASQLEKNALAAQAQGYAQQEAGAHAANIQGQLAAKQQLGQDVALMKKEAAGNVALVGKGMQALGDRGVKGGTNVLGNTFSSVIG